MFSTQRDLYVYLQAYAEAPSSAATASHVPHPPLIAFVGLYRDQKKVFETSAKAVTPQADSRLGTVPFSFDIPLNGIPPGRYECQVSVVDSVNHRVAFWVEPLLLHP
ncbi:MAG: hypothetical protein WA434_17985 [Candidatus Acidiferrales bacterium]